MMTLPKAPGSKIATGWEGFHLVVTIGMCAWVEGSHESLIFEQDMTAMFNTLPR